MTRKLLATPLDLSKNAIYVGPAPYPSPNGRGRSVVIIAGERAASWFTHLFKSLPTKFQRLLQDRRAPMPGHLTYWIIPDQTKAQQVGKAVRELFRKASARLKTGLEILSAPCTSIRMTVCRSTA